MKILLCGATGLLGANLKKYLNLKSMEVIGVGLSQQSDYQCDVSNFNEIDNIIKYVKPDIVINAISLTNVDECQKDLNLAFKLNVLTAVNITNSIKKNKLDSHLIYISTDHLYNMPGNSFENEVFLTNIYALTKRLAEIAIEKSNATILRVNFFGPGTTTKNISFSDWILNALKNKTTLNIFSDVYFSPLTINKLCELIFLVIQKRKFGIFNLGSFSGLSKYEFAVVLANEFKYDIELIMPVSLITANLYASRPLDMRMNSALFESEFNVKLPTLRDEILSLRK